MSPKQELISLTVLGMAQTIDDFNGDGLLDVYMIGMSSTTARRIVALGIEHPDYPLESKLRSAMGYGNRMLLSRGEKFITSPSADTVARTGWSWGTSSADFDNDRDRDLFVANGHVSGESCGDYCTRFWSHDIFTNNSKNNPAFEQVFLGELNSMIRRQTSWNGYEKNVLFLHDGKGDYLNAAYLLGVAHEFDSRAAASGALNGDGLVDLVVVELDQKRRSEVVHLIKNTLSTERNWTGVRLKPSPRGASLLGTKIFAIGPGHRQVSVIVAGDSFQAQHSPTAHFGLGDSIVERLEVHWPNGLVSRLSKPKLNTWIELTAPPIEKS